MPNLEEEIVPWKKEEDDSSAWGRRKKISR